MTYNLMPLPHMVLKSYFLVTLLLQKKMTILLAGIGVVGVTTITLAELQPLLLRIESMSATLGVLRAHEDPVILIPKLVAPEEFVEL